MTEVVRTNAVDRAWAAIRPRLGPWTVHAESRIGGRVDGDRLAAAAGTTMRRHPLLRARRGSGGGWVVPSEQRAPAVGFWTAVDDPAVAALRARLVSRRFDLRREPPVRFDVIRAPDGDHVVVVADHALVDGVGVSLTSSSLVAAYMWGRGAEEDRWWRPARLLAAAIPPPARVERTVAELRRRGSSGCPVRLAPEAGEAGEGAEAVEAAEVVEAIEGGDVLQAPEVVEGVEGTGRDGPHPDHGVAYRGLSVRVSRALASLPAGPSTATDVLVAAVCLAGIGWNRERGRPALPFTVAVPLNLRPARSWFEGVANASLPWPVRVDDASPPAVLGQVTDQLRRVRCGIYSTDVRALLAHLESRPGRESLEGPDRQALAATTMVSLLPGADIARMDLPAGLLASGPYGGTPAPPVMGMTFAVVSDAGAYRLSARYVRSRYSASGAAGFLSSVEEAVVQLCGLLGARVRPLAVVP